MPRSAPGYGLAALPGARIEPRDGIMGAMKKIFGIALIVAGTLGLVYGSFTYTKERHDVKLGPVQLSVKARESVNIPVWAGVGAIALGALLLLVGGRK